MLMTMSLLLRATKIYGHWRQGASRVFVFVKTPFPTKVKFALMADGEHAGGVDAGLNIKE
jgi:hypothetical protein